MSDISSLADRIYEEYDPEARGKAPSVTRAACEYLAYLAEGRRDDVTQDRLADEYGCSPDSIRRRKDDIVAAIDMNEVTA